MGSICPGRSKAELSKVLGIQLLLAVIKQKRMKQLHSSVPAELGDVVPIFGWEGWGVLLGRELLKRVLAEKGLQRAMSKGDFLCQRLLCSR